jgi:hypothetical protein
MIPNRDSIPQNQPKPKDAVSKLAGIALSMDGIAGDSLLYAGIIESSFVFEAGFAGVSVAGEQLIKNAVTPNNNKHRMI